MKKVGIVLMVVLAALFLGFILGPRAQFSQVDGSPIEITIPFENLDSIIELRESRVDGLKADNHSRFIWQDSLNATEYSLVYLHGFSASFMEAQPILSHLSERYNLNTYLPRLYQHGLEDVDAFTRLQPKEWMDSAREAIAIGKSIGQKVIVMSTSTGSTFAAYLAAQDDDIHALICTSPNFDLADTKSRLIVGPWGKQLMRFVLKSNYREWPANEEVQKYWTTKNNIAGHIALRDLLNQTMTSETFSGIHQPTYTGYYYKDDEHQDNVISVEAIHEFMNSIGTSEDNKRSIAFDNAVGHVISSELMNPHWEDVQESIFEFCDEILHLPQKQTQSVSDTGANTK